MTKRFTAAALAAVLLALGGATVVSAKAKKHTLSGTIDARVLKTVGNVVTFTGTTKIKGVGNGVVVILTAPAGDHFNLAGTAYFGNGTLRFTGTNKATANADGSSSFAGTLKITGGSGAGKTWRGTGTFTGSSTKEDPAFGTYSLKATVTY
jgi:hypothetical protein